MSATTSTITQADVDLGGKAVSIVIDLLAAAATFAAAFSCATWLGSIAAMVLVGFAMALLSALLKFYLTFAVAPETFGSIGQSIGGFAGRVSNLFSKKVTA